ncbi:Hypothetical predicted protein [Pelobates cultripes]|uniref:Transposase n=1 Tax=Pelobates cultripes TaxID=61616 RepID=A0AAD1W5U8_PELCU|nr:Hypothetical predicted protein [Pelobates cultripes]
MSSRKPTKKGPKEALSVAEMLTTQRPSPCGTVADTSLSNTGSLDAAASKAPEASNRATLQSLAEVKSYLASEIKHTAAEVKAKIAAIGARTTETEPRVARMVTAQNDTAKLTNTLQQKITDLEIELEDISNRSRRAILRHSRMRPFKHEGAEIQLYQDIAPATLLRRRAWKPVTDLLRQKGIRFSWGYTFKIIVFQGPTLAILLPTTNIRDFMKDLDITVLDDLQLPAELPPLPESWEDHNSRPA